MKNISLSLVNIDKLIIAAAQRGKRYRLLECKFDLHFNPGQLAPGHLAPKFAHFSLKFAHFLPQIYPVQNVQTFFSPFVDNFNPRTDTDTVSEALQSHVCTYHRNKRNDGVTYTHVPLI